MKEAKWVVFFIAIGLALAHFVGAPLRHEAKTPNTHAAPTIQDSIYAEGTMTLDASLDPQKYPVLYLYVRSPQNPMPIAVQRIDSPSFPLPFRLTDRDNMSGEGFYDGDIQVVARLDRDGNAGPKQPGDVETSVSILKSSPRTAQLKLGN